jgi:hypothetical protein
MIHDLDITKWPDATFAKWSALVDQNPTLEWNRKVVDPAKVSACSAKLTTSSLAGTTVNNSHLICTSKRFHDALQAIRLTPPSINGDAKWAFHAGSTARLIHGCTLLHHIDGNLHRDLYLIKQTLSSTRTLKSCPIAHLIPCVPFGIVRSDSSLTAAGGYCPAAKF